VQGLQVCRTASRQGIPDNWGGTLDKALLAPKRSMRLDCWSLGQLRITGGRLGIRMWTHAGVASKQPPALCCSADIHRGCRSKACKS